MSTTTFPEQLFELQLAGHKGYGLFATQNIKAGNRVICEEALIATPKFDNIGSLVEQLEALHSEQHGLYTELSFCTRNVNAKQRAALRMYLATQHQYTGKALDTALEDYVKMIAIYFTNVVSMGAQARWGCGLFLTYSRLNHSCRANLTNSYNATLGKLTVHANRDIKAGEELTTSYILNVRTKEQRQQELKATWGFECQCEVCAGRDEEALESEKRRTRMFEIDQGLALFSAGNTSMRAFAPGPVPRDTREALACAEELVELLKNEQISGMDLAQTYRECSKYSLAEGRYSKAMEYAQNELEVEKRCVGEETDHLEKDMEGAKFWVKHLENPSKGEQVKMRMNEKRSKKALKKQEKAAKKEGKGEK